MSRRDNAGDIAQREARLAEVAPPMHEVSARSGSRAFSALPTSRVPQQPREKVTYISSRAEHEAWKAETLEKLSDAREEIAAICARLRRHAEHVRKDGGVS